MQDREEMIYTKHRERRDKMKKTENVEMQGRERIGYKILGSWGIQNTGKMGMRDREGIKHKTHRR